MAAAGGRTKAQNIGLVLGLAALVSTLVIEPPAGISPAAWTVAGTMVLMAIWWATEALPFAATALVPLAILPPLGAASASSLAAGYGNTTLFLILGGFLLGLAMERCNLHRRIAYAIVARAGGQAQGLVLGMMCATGFVSMWVQNTSTTLMMLPVAVSIATIVAPDIGSGRPQRAELRDGNRPLRCLRRDHRRSRHPRRHRHQCARRRLHAAELWRDHQLRAVARVRDSDGPAPDADRLARARQDRVSVPARLADDRARSAHRGARRPWADVDRRAPSDDGLRGDCDLPGSRVRSCGKFPGLRSSTTRRSRCWPASFCS